MRRLPHQGADHGTVDHGFPSHGVFLLLHERVLPSRWLISLRRSSSSLSLACGWTSGANHSPLCRMAAPRLLGFKILRVQGKRDWTGHRSVLGRPAWADRPGPTLARFGRPFRSRGSLCIYVLCPLHLHDFNDVILASKMEVLFAWSSIFYASIPGGVPRSTSVLATFGSDFIKLMNTNKTP
jgi:hypothetical protein